MLRFGLAATAAIAAICSAQPVLAEETVQPTTVVYVFPTSPATFIPVAGLPSFLVMPGAVVPRVATQVVYTAPAPAVVATPVVAAAAVPAKVDCSAFSATVMVVAPDIYGLDEDGDGIGCEPAER